MTPEQYNAPHPHPENSYGKTYGEHREFLEFTVDQHAQLKEWCEQAGIIYSTSVWDMTSAKEIASLNPVFIKIPSACNTHYEMLQWLCDNYKGEIVFYGEKYMSGIDLYTIESTASVIHALKKIDDNKKGFLVVLTSGRVVGTLTDGDIRRAFIAGHALEDSITEIYAQNCTVLHSNEGISKAIDLFKNVAIKFLPIVDENGSLEIFLEGLNILKVILHGMIVSPILKTI